ncbi:MAG: alpha/beta fold hydrolase [Armatimonadetes bacterium]|nr:alpha/beta fold hydrolase [Armatimonadota bacterium]
MSRAHAIHARFRGLIARQLTWPVFLRSLLLAAVTAVALLYLSQGRILYQRAHYPAGTLHRLPPGVVPLSYSISPDGQVWQQKSFYVEPALLPSHAPRRLWVMFGGNGSVALGWLPLVNEARRRDPFAGFLLVDYPGYGFSEGTPSPGTILAGSEGALKALSAYLATPVPRLEQNIGSVGHSLGCATSLLFDMRHPVKRVVLASPFTSTYDMALRRVGWPLSHLLRDRYDNRARIRQLLKRRQAPRIVILHGDQDRVIPVTMGRSLPLLSPSIRFHELRGVNHVTIPHTGPGGLLEAMEGK